MDQRISLFTLAVQDLEASRRFYVEGLGWTPHLEVAGDVVMIQVGQRLLLSLWAASGFEAEVGPIRSGEGVVPVTIAHNVATDAEVDDVLATAERAGVRVWPAERREWGGYSGYFADPDGFRWEVACAGTEGPLAFLVGGGPRTQ
jgi:catechol 2,3-dioxygenase-like lactoylglutathione lyase family enzyme